MYKVIIASHSGQSQYAKKNMAASMLAGDDKLKRYDDYMKHCWPLFGGHLSCAFTETRTPRIHLLLPGFHPRFPMGEWGIHGAFPGGSMGGKSVGSSTGWSSQDHDVNDCSWSCFFPVLYLYLYTLIWNWWWWWWWVWWVVLNQWS